MIFLFYAFIFLCIQGFFSGMETGFVSLLRPRVEHEAAKNDKRAKKLLFFLDHSNIMIATTLVAINVSVVGASIMTKKFQESCRINSGWGLFLTTIVLSVLLLIFELVPKDWFRQSPYKRCAMGIWALYAVYLVLFLPIRFFAAFTEWLNRMIAKKDSEDKNNVQENFRLFLKESEHGGVLDMQTAGILEKAINIPALTVEHQCIPIEKVLDIPNTLTVKEAFDYAKKHNVDSLPVYSADELSKKGNHSWIKIFNIYDAIFSLSETEWEETNVTKCCSDIHRIRKSENILSALKISRNERVSLFVVVDHQGVETGVLSPDDLAACLFGSPQITEK